MDQYHGCSDTINSSSTSSITEELEEKDKEGIALLRAIFPETPTKTLTSMHLNRVHTVTSHHISIPSEALQDSIEGNQNLVSSGNLSSISLPDDFLRIPIHQALKVRNWITGVMEWKVVKDLEDSVIHRHLILDPDFAFQMESCQLVGSTVVIKDNENGFGIQLGEWDKQVYINALKCKNDSRIESIDAYNSAVKSSLEWDSFGPAFVSGLKPGDRILGVNGIPFLKSGIHSFYTNHSTNESRDMLNFAVECIRNSANYLIVHLIRPVVVCHSQLELAVSTRDSVCTSDESTLSGKTDEINRKSNRRGESAPPKLETDYIHPIVKLLRLKGLSKSRKDESKLSKELVVYNSRARLWDTNSYLHNEYFGCRYYRVPKGLEKVRQALCVHIVNSFLEKDCLVYTIWIQDVESNSTWYAPLRFSHEFHDLRAAILSFDKSIATIPFPKLYRWLGREQHMSRHIQESQGSELEHFLQELCNRIYKSEDTEYISEISSYVQSFLGCDDIDFIKNIQQKRLDPSSRLNPGVMDLLLNFQQAVRLYTFRIFLLSSLQILVARFITDVKARVSIMETKKSITPDGLREKEKIISEITMVRTVLSSLVKLVISGCRSDFDIIIHSHEYEPLLNSYSYDDLEKVIEGSVREQVETIIYIPLRSSLSSLILHGWRHDDHVVEKKMAFLRQKRQDFFKIKPNDQSPSNWRSVIEILRQGVGKSPLPCQKLNYIVQAAKAIAHVRAEEHVDSESNSLGADDFLPIFIYCFVQSKIERPCALCALLRHFAESSQQIGEVGYYLSSYEAALVYIIELDLSNNSSRNL